MLTTPSPAPAEPTARAPRPSESAAPWRVARTLDDQATPVVASREERPGLLRRVLRLADEAATALSGDTNRPPCCW